MVKHFTICILLGGNYLGNKEFNYLGDIACCSGESSTPHVHTTHFNDSLWGERWHGVVVQSSSLQYFRGQLFLYLYVAEEGVDGITLSSSCLF